MTNGRYLTNSYLSTIGSGGGMGTKERKEREREARRNDILDAAKNVFFDKGFNGTTMDQIAEVAELSKGSLYLHFPSKEDLYVSILLEGLDLLNETFKEAVEGIKGWENKLRRIGQAYYDFYKENNNYFRILFFLYHSEIATHVSAELYQMCFEKGLSCLNYLNQALKEGTDAGEIEPLDPMGMSFILWGAFNGIFFLSEEEDHKRFIPGSLDQLIGLSMDMMINGLKRR